MIVVFSMMAALWGIGMLTGAPKRARWVMIAVLLAGVIAVQFALPDGHPLREATGGHPALWLLLLAGAALVWGYARILGRVKARAQAAQAPQQQGTFSDVELERYARHMILREIGGPGQKALKDSRVLVIGAGGLGAPALQYLAAAGVGTIGVIDDDVVDLSNLQRQVIHAEYRVGEPKVFSAEETLSFLNPHVSIKPYNRRLEPDMAAELIAEYDLVLDGSDNFDTRYLVNQICADLGKPLIAAALTQWEGQISVYDPARGTPCYACIFPERPAPGLAPSCAEAGVLGPLPGVVGSMMAVEAVKAITGAGEGLRGRMLIYDALYGDTRIMGLKRRADCPVCGG